MAYAGQRCGAVRCGAVLGLGGQHALRQSLCLSAPVEAFTGCPAEALLDGVPRYLRGDALRKSRLQSQRWKDELPDGAELAAAL